MLCRRLLCEVKNHLIPSVFIYEFKESSTKILGRILLADDTVLVNRYYKVQVVISRYIFAAFLLLFFK